MASIVGRLAVFSLACQLLGAGLAGAGELPPPGARLEGERLTLNVQQLPLIELLATLNAGTSIAVDLHGDASRITISDSFRSLELDRALRRMLSAHSHLLIDHGTIDSRRHMEVILLGVAGSVSRPKVQPIERPEESAISPDVPLEDLIGQAVSIAPAEDRAAAAEAIAYRASNDDDATRYADAVLRQMLSDPDEVVRARALETLKDTADRVPFEALAQVAREDASPERRIQALELLVERSENGESQAPLRIALHDPEPSVRTRVRELIEDWHIAVDGG